MARITPIREAAQHRPRQRADAAERRRGEGVHAGAVAEIEADGVVVERVDHAGGATERAADEEGGADHAVDVDPHGLRRDRVLRHRAHGLAGLGVAHERGRSSAAP